MANTNSGGFVSFEGWVRDHHQGRAVTGLSYHSYRDMALSQGQAICRRACERFDIDAAQCVHRLGDLSIGDCAVWVGVSAAHRAAAFAACEYIITEIKSHVPIWKHETYTDGSSQWVGCIGCQEHSGESPQDQRYSRQMAMPGVGQSGQQRLRQAHVVVVGAGALGCPLADSLASAGVGHITLVDGDTVAISNLHRQPLYTENDVGRRKVHAAVERVRARNSSVDVTPVANWLDDTSAHKLIHAADLVIDCTDNAACKQRVSVIARQHNTAWVIAGIYRQDGGIYVAPDSPKDGVCWHCVAGGASSDCAVSGVLGPSATALGALAANEALKRLLGLHSGLTGHWSVLDMANGRFNVFKPQPQHDCDCQPIATTIELNHAATGLHWLDIRSAQERQRLPLDKAVAIDSGRLLESPQSVLNPDQPYLIICSRGVRSLTTTQALREQGWKQVWSLQGGASQLVSA